MPKFDATSVGDVEYDFTGWKGVKGSAFAGQPINDKGVIPEPSRHLVSQTMSRVTAAFKSLDSNTDVDETPEAIAAAMEKINDEETFEKMGDELTEAMAELCDGSPSRESLEALGWRKFMAFFGYVMGELMSPEVDKSVSGNTQKRLKSV